MQGNQAYFQGRAARRAGESVAACPYAEGSYQARDWLRGWHDIDGTPYEPKGPDLVEIITRRRAAQACRAAASETLKAAVDAAPISVPLRRVPAKPKPAKKTNRTSRVWTRLQDERFRYYWLETTLTPSQIAVEIDRTVSSLYSRQRLLKLPKNGQRPVLDTAVAA